MNNDTIVVAEIRNYETSGEWIEHPDLLSNNGGSAKPYVSALKCITLVKSPCI